VVVIIGIVYVSKRIGVGEGCGRGGDARVWGGGP
jgi:hypothetical protein